MALVVKNLPANAGDIKKLGLIPGQEAPLEKETAANSNILVWRIPWTERPGMPQYPCQRAMLLLFFFFFFWNIIDLQCCVSFRYTTK